MLLTKLIPESNIIQMFTVNISELVEQFRTKCQAGVSEAKPDPNESLVVIQDKEYKKLSSTVDMELALKLYNIYR